MEEDLPADVEIGAVVRAKRLRFKRVPETDVRFHGEPGREEESRSERENLPDEVEPHVTYHDVRVRWRAAARAGSKKPRGGGAA